MINYQKKITRGSKFPGRGERMQYVRLWSKSAQVIIMERLECNEGEISSRYRAELYSRDIEN